MGLKVTVMGAALTVCGTAAPLLFYGGLVLMVAGLCIPDKVYEEQKHDKN